MTNRPPYCKCAFTDPDGTFVPGEACAIHPDVKPQREAPTSKQETNRDKALRGEPVALTNDRLREIQEICRKREGCMPSQFHWHWLAMVNELIDRRAHETSRDEGYQARVYDWMKVCFQRPDAMLPAQRAFRFVEEALELAQASGTSREDVLRLVAYTFSRPPGVIDQELGGVMVTLAALATSFGLSLDYAAEVELKRCHENTEKIRAKDLAKPQRSPLPGSPEEPAREHLHWCAIRIGKHCNCHAEGTIQRLSEKATELPMCDCDPDFGCKEYDSKIFRCCQQEMEKRSAHLNGPVCTCDSPAAGPCPAHT